MKIPTLSKASIAYVAAIGGLLLGISTILFYTPTIFESAGIERNSAFWQAVVVGLIFLAGTIIPMFLIKQFGRKPLLYAGIALMAVSLTCTGVFFKNATYQLTENQIQNVVTTKKILFNFNLLNLSSREFDDEHSFLKEVDLAVQDFPTKSSELKAELLKNAIKVNADGILWSILCFVTGYSISLSMVIWKIFLEILPNMLRGFTILIIAVVNAIVGFLVTAFFPIQLVKMGSINTYFIYAIFMCICLWFIWKLVAKTNEKLLEKELA